MKNPRRCQIPKRGRGGCSNRKPFGFGFQTNL